MNNCGLINSPKTNGNVLFLSAWYLTYAYLLIAIIIYIGSLLLDIIKEGIKLS